MPLTSRTRFGVIPSSLEPDCCSSTVVNGMGLNLLLGFVSTVSTVAKGRSIHCSYSSMATGRSNKCTRRHLKTTSVGWPPSSSLSRSIETEMNQNGSGTNDCTRLYWSTTKPRVGNWQGPGVNAVHIRQRTITNHFLAKVWHPGLEGHSHESSEGCADAQVERYSCLHRVCHTHIEIICLATCLVNLSERLTKLWLLNLRSDDGTEASPLNDNASVGSSANLDNLRPNVLAFAIAIGPDHEKVGSTRLVLEIPLNLLEFL